MEKGNGYTDIRKDNDELQKRLSSIWQVEATSLEETNNWQKTETTETEIEVQIFIPYRSNRLHSNANCNWVLVITRTPRSRYSFEPWYQQTVGMGYQNVYLVDPARPNENTLCAWQFFQPL